MHPEYVRFKTVETTILEYVQTRGVNTSTANFQDFFSRVATTKEKYERSNSYISDVDQALQIREDYQSMQDLYQDMSDKQIVKTLAERFSLAERKIRKILGLSGGYTCSNALTF